MPTKPITPTEAAKAVSSSIPDTVIETFNLFIGQNYLRGTATIRQEDIVAHLVEFGYTRQEIFKNRWLDVEALFEHAGWKVTYDKPAYNETYPATFTFTKTNKQED